MGFLPPPQGWQKPDLWEGAEFEDVEEDGPEDDYEDEEDAPELMDEPLDEPVRPIITEKAPGRNDPCPCGSGKKYKRCCGRS